MKTLTSSPFRQRKTMLRRVSEKSKNPSPGFCLRSVGRFSDDPRRIGRAGGVRGIGIGGVLHPERAFAPIEARGQHLDHGILGNQLVEGRIDPFDLADRRIAGAADRPRPARQSSRTENGRPTGPNNSRASRDGFGGCASAGIPYSIGTIEAGRWMAGRERTAGQRLR